MDAFHQREGKQQPQPLSHPSGPRASIRNRRPSVPSQLLTSEKDHAGMNVLLALVLYNTTISSYN